MKLALHRHSAARQAAVRSTSRRADHLELCALARHFARIARRNAEGRHCGGLPVRDSNSSSSIAALLYTTASRATLFIYIAPFVVVLGSHFLVPRDRFRWTQWAGLLMSFTGIVLAFGVPMPSANANQVLGDADALLGGIAWGFTTLVVKSTIARPRRTGEDAAISIGESRCRCLPWLRCCLAKRITQMPGALALCVDGLSDHLGGCDHLPALVHAGGAHFPPAGFRPSPS